THIPSLSLHDALPIYQASVRSQPERMSRWWMSSLYSSESCFWAGTTRNTVMSQVAMTSTRPNKASPAVVGGGRNKRSRQAVNSRSEEHTSELQSRGHL